MNSIRISLHTVLLLAASNVFMTSAGKRIGYAGGLTLAQLKITQEVITLAVFIPFAMIYMNQPFKLDFVRAGLCMVGAV